MLHNASLIKQLVEMCKLGGCRPSKTLQPHSLVIQSALPAPLDRERNHLAIEPCMEAVGTLLCLANTVSPDIALPAGILSRYMSYPNLDHCHGGLYPVKHLSGTPKLAVSFENETDQDLVGFSNADYAGCRDSRESTSGFLFTSNSGGSA